MEQKAALDSGLGLQAASSPVGHKQNACAGREGRLEEVQIWHLTALPPAAPSAPSVGLTLEAVKHPTAPPQQDGAVGRKHKIEANLCA